MSTSGQKSSAPFAPDYRFKLLRGPRARGSDIHRPEEVGRARFNGGRINAIVPAVFSRKTVESRDFFRAGRPLGFRFSSRDGSRAASPLATLLLLALFGHAFFASATHFHRVRSAGGSSPVASVGEREGAQQSPTSGGHAECLLCRLQRNYVSNLQHTTTEIVAPACRPQGHLDTWAASVSAAHFLAPSGRAPPHA